jgi:hypothetical protein
MANQISMATLNTLRRRISALRKQRSLRSVRIQDPLAEELDVLTDAVDALLALEMYRSYGEYGDCGPTK